MYDVQNNWGAVIMSYGRGVGRALVDWRGCAQTALMSSSVEVETEMAWFCLSHLPHHRATLHGTDVEIARAQFKGHLDSLPRGRVPPCRLTIWIFEKEVVHAKGRREQREETSHGQEQVKNPGPCDVARIMGFMGKGHKNCQVDVRWVAPLGFAFGAFQGITVGAFPRPSGSADRKLQNDLLRQQKWMMSGRDSNARMHKRRTDWQRVCLHSSKFLHGNSVHLLGSALFAPGLGTFSTYTMPTKLGSTLMRTKGLTQRLLNLWRGGSAC